MITWYAFGSDYMLNNERYMGDALLQKKYTTDTLPFRRKENRGECPQYYVENANPTIVSRESYAAVQELQKSRQKNVEGRKPLIRCPECSAVPIAAGRTAGSSSGGKPTGSAPAKPPALQPVQADGWRSRMCTKHSAECSSS